MSFCHGQFSLAHSTRISAELFTEGGGLATIAARDRFGESKSHAASHTPFAVKEPDTNLTHMHHNTISPHIVESGFMFIRPIRHWPSNRMQVSRLACYLTSLIGVQTSLWKVEFQIQGDQSCPPDRPSSSGLPSSRQPGLDL